MTGSPGQLQELELELKLDRLAALRHTIRRWPSWVPSAVAFTGGAIGAASAALHLRSASHFHEYDRHFLLLNCSHSYFDFAPGCLPSEIPPKLQARLNRARLEQSIAVGGYVIGASMVAAGIALFYLRGFGPEEMHAERPRVDGVTVAPVVSTDMLGISILVNR